MALEIEHKYLVINDSYLTLCDPRRTRRISQGYLNRDPERTVRVRLTQQQDCTRGFLTVKGFTAGDTRHEYEYEIPAADALEMLALCQGEPVVKTRYYVPAGELTWEVDIFEGRNAGLRVAEIELQTSDTSYELPPFVGREVTGEKAYYNSAL